MWTLSEYDDVSNVASDIISFTVFDRETCADIVELAVHRSGFRLSEKDEYAAYEVKLEELDSCKCMDFCRDIVNYVGVIVWDVWRLRLNAVVSAFVTRYTMTSQRGLRLHHDFQSDVTLSVVLNDEFDGGGLHFPRQEYLSSGLPVGRGLIFPGKVTHPHRAEEIQSGERYVLTVWMRFIP